MTLTETIDSMICEHGPLAVLGSLRSALLIQVARAEKVQAETQACRWSSLARIAETMEDFPMNVAFKTLRPGDVPIVKVGQ